MQRTWQGLGRRILAIISHPSGTLLGHSVHSGQHVLIIVRIDCRHSSTVDTGPYVAFVHPAKTSAISRYMPATPEVSSFSFPRARRDSRDSKDNRSFYSGDARISRATWHRTCICESSMGPLLSRDLKLYAGHPEAEWLFWPCGRKRWDYASYRFLRLVTVLRTSVLKARPIQLSSIGSEPPSRTRRLIICVIRLSFYPPIQPIPARALFGKRGVRSGIRA